MPDARWQLLVPVKPAEIGKSRLGAGARVARAIALDTIAAAAGTAAVARVLVVTADRGLAPALADFSRVDVLVEPAPRGIAAAIEAGLAELDPDAPRGVLLGDLPALRRAELDAALALAALHDRAFVRDAEGTGTTLVTADAGVELLARFGPDSAARHAAAGLAELGLPAGSTLRRDVDTREDLEEARRLGTGAATFDAASAGEG